MKKLTFAFLAILTVTAVYGTLSSSTLTKLEVAILDGPGPLVSTQTGA